MVDHGVVEKNKMALSNEADIDVEAILSNVHRFESGVEGRIEPEILLIIGGMGAGKSALMNMMAGKPMEIVRRGGTHRIDVVGGDYAGEITAPGFEMAKIVDGGDPGTNYPNYIMFRGLQGWDCPGDRDTRTQNEIENRYYIHKILSVAAKRDGVKLLIVQDHNSCSVERGSAFKSSIKTLCEIFEPQQPQDFSKLIDATTFVFNMVPESDMSPEDPQDYLRWRIHGVDTNTPRDPHKEYSEWASATFIGLMKTLNEELPDNIRHVEIPKATKDKGFIDFLVQCVRDPKCGIWAKVSASHAVKDFTPKLVVSNPTAVKTVWEVNARYQSKFKEHCGLIETLLMDLFKNETKDSIVAILEGLFKTAEIDESSLACGGASELSLKLIQYLEDLDGSPEYKRVLQETKTTINRMQFFNSILRNVQAGSNFTELFGAAKKAASKYITLKNREVMDEYMIARDRYLEEQNNLSTAKKILAVTAFAGAGITSMFCQIFHVADCLKKKAMGQDFKWAEGEYLDLGKGVANACTEFLKEAFGTLKPPDEEKSKFAAKLQAIMKRYGI